MAVTVYVFLATVVALAVLWVFAINTSIKALRLADPALYRAAASEIAGRQNGSSEPEASIFSMRNWLRRKWHHDDIRKHRAVRRWMNIHRGAQVALVALCAFGVASLALN